ncbi:HIT family protein [Altererythrobacter arenosus]|uniref:HIT family protein n=1 Tax=Altererythrobacter arenosus TaxID=3032592 RepID=A0ABY8FUU2_9SPHN|nr:HIT family protein [Altererythrobacter sp. CAU 1644]WFL77176.1 HIT family protein [Altererythrobacter sp. CAU 1644]
MNETIEKFGFPSTLLREFEHWVVLLRPAQPTLGSLVLAAKSDATDFSALPPAAHAELAEATKAIEDALKRFVDYSKINYLMLMMVDPNVHFHVIPRYEGSRDFGGVAFFDAGWPKLPDLGSAVALTDMQIAQLKAALNPLLA